MEYVYLMVASGKPLVKIGYSRDPVSRMRKVRHPDGCGADWVLMTIETDRALFLEEALHRHFADKRVKGEWFDIDMHDVEWITADRFVHPVSGEDQSIALTCRCHLPRWFKHDFHHLPN